MLGLMASMNIKGLQLLQELPVKIELVESHVTQMLVLVNGTLPEM